MKEETYCSVTRAQDFHTAAWSGGETVEIGIYPPGATYVKRDFLWRISSATVAVGKSVFTVLPGVRRVLMVLDGRVTLCHKNGTCVALKPYETAAFSGAEQTTSFGMCRDFNLMMRENCRGYIESLEINGCRELILNKSVFEQIVGIYSAQGSLQITCRGNSTELGQNDFFSLQCSTGVEPPRLKIMSESPIRAVLVRIEY